jgi:2-oxoglutarate ferredoxin oxidoreductase subunit alpha
MSETVAPVKGTEKPRKGLERAVIRFAGDSGDGMQLTGEQFTTESAWAGNDIATLPNFPAEIRAPAGTLFGVSSFQLQFGSQRVYTPGDRLDCLVAMNPAALKVHLRDLKPGGLLIVNTAAFDKRNLDKAGYAQNPLDDPALAERYRLHKVDMTGLTHEAIKDLALNTKEKDRTKNFFALGLVSWIYTRPLEPTLDWINKKFAKSADIAQANTRVLKAGHAFGETAEIFGEHYTVDPADMAPGLYRAMTGNRALAWGLLAAAERSKVPVVYGAYPITPASGILEELAMHKRFRIRTIQAEDEIAAVTAAIGASFGGAIGVTGSSGPGIALKGEGIGLAVTAELPLVVLNIQRAGPSTGMPTKTEQADLMQALYGRNSESPVAVLAPATPGDCFYIAYEAVRIAAKYMMPVIVLSDGFLANGSEPWLIPDVNTLPPIEIQFRTSADGFFPYLRDPATLARPWVRPGTPGLEHRIGGIEKQDVTGNISYDPENHDHMVKTRAEKVRRVAQEIPPTTINGPATGDLLVVGWGGTYGAITAAVERAQTEGKSVASVHLRHLNPLPPDLGHILREYRKVLVPEINSGQLVRVLRAEYLVDAVGFNRVRGLPLASEEIYEAIVQLIGSKV